MKKVFTILILLSLFGLNCSFAQEKFFFYAKPTGSNYYTIWSMNIDGTQKTKLFSDSINRVGCKISNDGNYLYYMKRLQALDSEGSDSIWICKSQLNGSNEQVVYRFPNFTTYGIRWNFNISNDEQEIIYSTNTLGTRDGDIFKYNIITHSLTQLTNDVDYAKNDPIYQPNSDSIVYTKNGTTWFADPWPMYKMKNDGTGNHLFQPMGTGHYEKPTFSKDGSKFAYCYVANVGGLYNLYISNPNGSNNYMLTPSSGAANDILFPTFNSNVTKIAFVRTNYSQVVISDLIGNVETTIPLNGQTEFNGLIWANINNIQDSIVIPDTISHISSTIEIPVRNTTSLLTSNNIISYQFNVTYNTNKLQYISSNLTGTIASGGNVVVNSSTPGKLLISYMTSTPLIGTGNLLKLKFQPLQFGTSQLAISNFLYNTDTITNTHNGNYTAIGMYGDIDTNGHVQAYDAALDLQYSVGLDPLPTSAPRPWADWRYIVANVDGSDTISANDASLILQYSAGVISSFPVGLKSLENPIADITITQGNNELIITSTGELYGLNIFTTNGTNVTLETPTSIDANMLSAFNIAGSTYNVGLCTAYTPADNTTIMKIPFTCTVSDTLTFNMFINKNTVVKKIFVDKSLGINENNKQVVNIYPNPVKDNLTLGTNSNTEQRLEIINLFGQTVYSIYINKKATINTSALANGVYILKLSSDKETVVKKFVKEY